MTLSPSFWKVSETKISDKVSHVTPLSELNEMVQYLHIFTSLVELTSPQSRTFGKRQRLMLPTPPLALPSPTAVLPHHTQLNEVLPLLIAYLAFTVETLHLHDTMSLYPPRI